MAVAEERNFTRAAVRLYVAQSGLSATVRSLERDLRTQLFLRTTRQVELTPAGQALSARLAAPWPLPVTPPRQWPPSKESSGAA